MMELICGACQGRFRVSVPGTTVACPHCGTHVQAPVAAQIQQSAVIPNKPQSRSLSPAQATILILILILIAGLFAWSPDRNRKAADLPVKETANAELQQKRKQLIDDLYVKGVFDTIDGDPRWYVTPKFMALDFGTKQKFAGILFAWKYKLPADESSSGEILLLYDSITGKRVGHFSDRGLKME